MTNSKRIMETITTPTLTFRQRVLAMAKIAEDSVDPICYSKKTDSYMKKGIIYDMGEGSAPYRPRYSVPDFGLFMRQGSEFLGLKKPTDIMSAVGNLMCLYHNLSGAGGLPVYIGSIDTLLEPFIEDEKQAREAIHMLLQHVDCTISDAFCHVNLGPYDTKAGRIILDLTAEMKRSCPNMSLLYRQDTPDDYALHALRASLESSKPSFANDRMYRQDMGDYAVVSCYNVLPIGGSGMTLVRLNLHNLPLITDDKERLLNEVIPDVVDSMCEVIDKRSRFIIEDCSYFENSFLFNEGLIHNDKEHMVGMFGYAGLAECVNKMVKAVEKSSRYGNSAEADELGERIMDKLSIELQKREAAFGKYALHAQVGVAEDTDCSPGGRIPVGDEPEMPQHLRHFARMHKHCTAGCGEIFPFDVTAKKNPEALLNILKGAFESDVRYMSFYSNDSDLVRVTGYLVKRSDIEKFSRNQAVKEGATVLGAGINKNLGLLNRKERNLNV